MTFRGFIQEFRGSRGSGLAILRIKRVSGSCENPRIACSGPFDGGNRWSNSVFQPRQFTVTTRCRWTALSFILPVSPRSLPR
jgi:hypothetical protein